MQRDNATLSTHEVMAAFRQVVEAINGALPNEIQADGQLHRFQAANDKHGQLSGWYVLFLDGVPAGSCGNWKTGVQENWCAVDASRLTPAERDAMSQRARQQRERTQQEQQRRQAEVAGQVRTWWKNAKPASPNHPYLTAKRVKPFGLRQYRDVLLVPLMDGELVNLQRIYPDGSKRFVAGGKVRGCYSPLGKVERLLYVCEGWATGATIHQLTGAAVACAMNCGNLKTVAMRLHHQYPECELIIAGDNDRHTEGNPGKRAAMEAAQAIGAEWMLPDFPDNLPGSDYNDRYRLELEGRL